MQKTAVVKLGTNALLDTQGNIEESVLVSLAQSVVNARKEGWRIVLVSSGAVGTAKKEFNPEQLGKISAIELAQIRSAVGQPMLMKKYRDVFQKHHIPVAQGLVTRSDFASRERHLAMRNILEKMLHGDILPILNENDFLTPEELDFSDNDQLAGFLAGLLSADVLVLLSNVDGLYTGNPKNPESQKLNVVERITPEILQGISEEKSEHGLGGMRSKIETAHLMGNIGIELVISTSRTPDVLSQILRKEPGVGTRFLPLRGKKQSGIRVWLAAGAAERGSIVVNQCLTAVLKTHPGTSILGVGVLDIVRDFREGDVIRIDSENKEPLGRAVAKLSSSVMQTILASGETRGKVFVHADDLFLFSPEYSEAREK